MIAGRVDVTDAAAMKALLDDTRARFGTIHGVIHAAGVLDDGLIQMKTAASCLRVLAPKVEGALVLRPCRQVHTFGMHVPIDVLWCDGSGRVLRVASLARGRVSRPVLRARFVVEAADGAADRWRIRVGDILEVTGDE